MNFILKQKEKHADPPPEKASDGEPEASLPKSFSSHEVKPPRDANLKTNAMIANTNILSNDVHLTGSLKFSNELTIDGTIEGEVTSDGNLTVGKNARIKGDIKTKSVTIYGTVEGNISVTGRAELKAEAALLGDIRAGTMSIEQGATFLGSSAVGSKTSREGALPGPQTIAPAAPPAASGSAGSRKSPSAEDRALETKLAAAG